VPSCNGLFISNFSFNLLHQTCCITSIFSWLTRFNLAIILLNRIVFAEMKHKVFVLFSTIESYILYTKLEAADG